MVHGDCVLDERLGCTILGGDAITETLAAHLRPRRVVFLTNVDGVFTKPPHMPGAHLVQVGPKRLMLTPGQFQGATALLVGDVFGEIQAAVALFQRDKVTLP